LLGGAEFTGAEVPLADAVIPDSMRHSIEKRADTFNEDHRHFFSWHHHH